MVAHAADRLAAADGLPDCLGQRGRRGPLHLHAVLSDMTRLKWLWLRWTTAASHIGDFQARWLLTVFYFTLAAPFGLIARLALDPLLIYHQPAGSAWIRREAPAAVGLEDLQKQF